MMPKNYGQRALRKAVKGKTDSTPGKTKGENCKANTLDRFFAKYSRGHKHSGYGSWCRKMDANFK